MSIKDNEDACQRCDGVFKSKEGKIICDNCLKGIAPDLWQELEKQSTELKYLKVWISRAAHLPLCKWNYTGLERFPCDCGLHELLKEKEQ